MRLSGADDVDLQMMMTISKQPKARERKGKDPTASQTQRKAQRKAYGSVEAIEQRNELGDDGGA